jgi:hypothetical protein
MEYIKPQYPVPEVNRAGRLAAAAEQSGNALSVSDELTWAFEVLSNWRAAHHRPLNTFYMTLKARALRIDQESIPSQRIKRLESIASKLTREPSMKLSQMQDIGGCRVVLRDLDAVRSLEAEYEGKSGHTRKSSKDYIVAPKLSGYRGIHLIYAFKGRDASEHDGLKVEIQLRTKLQHIWATAVEAAGTFTNQALKSSQGSAEWRRFFALVSSWFAHLEGTPLVPGTPTEVDALRTEIIQLATNIHVVGVLNAYSSTLQGLAHLRRGKYYLMQLDAATLETSVRVFSAAQTEKANAAYIELERSLPPNSGKQVVLVSVESLQALRQAYPNYFLDTAEFVQRVQEILAAGA